MSEKKILTLHPRGKKGVNINKNKYYKIKTSIINCLTTKELTQCVNKKLKGKFQGSINWYIETVKLDLEARKIIKRNKNIKPQTYELI